MTGRFHVGDWIVVRVSKFSTRPGKRATNVTPTRGEAYTYQVEKYWMVTEVHGDGQLTVVTRKGKSRKIPADSPALRKANWWERWFHRDRFPDNAVPRKLAVANKA